MELKNIQEKLKIIESDIQRLIKDIGDFLEREEKDKKESKEPKREEHTVCRI